MLSCCVAMVTESGDNNARNGPIRRAWVHQVRVMSASTIWASSFKHQRPKEPGSEGTMTLTCLAIVGKDNEPLYLRDAENVKLANGNGNSKQEVVLDPTEEVLSADIQDCHDDNDVFGILAWNNQPDSLTIRHEVRSLTSNK